MGTLRETEAAFQVIAPGRSRYLTQTDKLMMVVVDFKDGPHANPDPPHSHPHEQVTYVAEGEIVFFLDGVSTRLKAGDMFTVPGGIPHTVQALTPVVRLIDVFTPIREDFLQK